MSAPDIVLDAVGKRFDDATPLLVDFSLAIAPGSITALVGPSGVGKSTLLRLVGGIDTALSGQVRVGGTIAATAPAAGLVFQDARLLPWLSVRRNITDLAGVETAVADRLLDAVGLAAAGDLYPHQLSGGMQRRVALARALAANPHLLLLDEPFVSLDRALADSLRAMLLDLVTAARSTVLLVTHDPEDAAMLADRVVLLAGRPVEIAADLAVDIPAAGRTLADRADIVSRILAAGYGAGAAGKLAR